MGMLRRKVPSHYVPIEAENVPKKDWAILLEVGTIVGEPHEKIRVAVATVDKKIVVKRNIFMRKSYFLVLDGYDPRIHTLYFCPQLYKHGADGQLVPLEGEEIGKLLAESVKDGVKEKRPWYEPGSRVPIEPIISPSIKPEFDTMTIGAPPRRDN
jgi:hypothetical protein